jgi:general secretion pathway protein A
MYESYWKLARKPFENAHDAKFYYPSESHQGALLKLRYVVENRRGAALLSGPAGVGKSLLIRSLFRVLPESVAPRTHLVFPRMPGDQLLAYIADELTGQPPTHDVATAKQSVHRIQTGLTENAEAGRHAVLVIDEAQALLDADTWELIRLLLNFELDTGPAMTMLLVGQGEMLPAIERVPSLEERLAVKCILRPFTCEETVSYISHRLSTAGGQHTIFADSSMDAIHQLSGGVPRRINRLCELALLIGYAEQRETIEVDQIDAVSDELLTVSPE